MRCLWLITVLLTHAGTAFAQTDSDRVAALRAEFLAAFEGARAGLPGARPDSEELRTYSLFPYVEAARLARDVSALQSGWSEADVAAESFLAERDGEPVTINLRVAWLRSLESRELWPEFLKHYRENIADTALRCRYLAGRIAENNLTGIAPLILDEWLTPFQLPLDCEPVFQWLRDQGPLDDQATAARVRLLLENGQAGFARIIARRLPEEAARPLLGWADLIERPLSTIEAYTERVAGDFEAGMLLDGWSRLSRNNPAAAEGLHDLLITTEGFDSGVAGPYTRALALGLAWDRHPAALDYFGRVPDTQMDDYALEWQARAALWSGDFELARRAIQAMSAEQRLSAQWRYWGARVSQSRDERRNLYDSILAQDNYFAAAAAARLGERAATNPLGHPRDPAVITRIAALPAVSRAIELWRIGLPVAAIREWRFGYAALDSGARTQSIHVAMDAGWFDLAIATATEHGVFFDYDLLYPQPYPGEIEAAAREFDVEPALLNAVMRQESLYRVDAVSSAGAVGLMQLQPGTAADVARRLGEAAPSRTDLMDPAVNLRLGAARLAELIERYGNVVPALAAYNAGPSAADRWLPDEPLHGDVWLENVPYNETRDYVRRVLWHTVVFRSLDGDRTDTEFWLDEVGGGG